MIPNKDMGTSSAMLCDLGQIFLLVDLQNFFRFSVGGESSENDQITGQFQSFSLIYGHF